jgi:hypothetical protein
VSGCFITLGRKRSLVVVVAACLLIFGAAGLRKKPLDVVAKFSPLSLVLKTESLGLSRSEVEWLITVPFEADLVHGLPWLPLIRPASMAGLSTVNITLATDSESLKAGQKVRERLPEAHAVANVSGPRVMLESVPAASLARVPGIANAASIWGQRAPQVHINSRKSRKKAINPAQTIARPRASAVTHLNSSTPGTGGFIDTPSHRFNTPHHFPVTLARTFSQTALTGTTARAGEVAQVREGHQSRIRDGVFGADRGTSKRLWRLASS